MGGGSPRCSKPVVLLSLFRRGHSFSAFCFLLTDSLFVFVIDYLGIGFVLFVDTILDVLVLV